ncbi:MAG TPA: hypothetical protein VE571_12640, partial [Solirubrobacteraceae bacterium]|nr:hypothetical protein [Solirubrobacteraceae bacterium]
MGAGGSGVVPVDVEVSAAGLAAGGKAGGVPVEPPLVPVEPPLVPVEPPLVPVELPLVPVELPLVPVAPGPSVEAGGGVDP